MDNQQTQQEQEIDLLELIRMLLNRWYIIGAALVLVFSATAIYAYGVLNDTYTSRASIMVNVRDDAQWDSSDLALAQRLIDTYTDVAESNTALTRVREETNLDYSNNRLRDMISITRGRSDSVILYIEVESEDPEHAALIANAMVSTISDMSVENNALYDVEELDTAFVPENPSGPNRMLYLAIGIVLGGMIGVFSVFVIEFLDKTVKTTKDIENKLGLRVLGVIPDYALEEVEDDA